MDKKALEIKLKQVHYFIIQICDKAMCFWVQTKSLFGIEDIFKSSFSVTVVVGTIPAGRFKRLKG